MRRCLEEDLRSRGAGKTRYRAVRGVLEKKTVQVVCLSGPGRGSGTITPKPIVPMHNISIHSHVPVNKIRAVVLEIVYWPLLSSLSCSLQLGARRRRRRRLRHSPVPSPDSKNHSSLDPESSESRLALQIERPTMSSLW
jgi:hypothetical protein